MRRSKTHQDKGGSEAGRPAKNISALTLGALGVVFGDIGTNPLYAIRQCLQDLQQKSVDPASVLGILSLIFWALILVVCLKYLTFIIQAEHEGEGGTLAMLALIHTKRPPRNTAAPGALILLVLFASALLFGDGVITPAISVLSAMEGLKIAWPGAQPFVVPISLGILIALFLLQSRGTGRVGKLFGPVMGVWFLAIAALGVAAISGAPQVLQALSPWPGLEFLLHHGGRGIVVLGAVVLCFSGTEALFADLSHFGKWPIELGWYGLVLPSLLLNYFGQGALLLTHPDKIDAPFFTMVPSMLLYPMVALATVATIIASQALISGAFSLTEQAIHMGYCPPFEIVHTADDQRGQVYIRAINYGLMVACVGVVLAFQTSAKLGGAYGLAVIGTMTITSLTYFVVLRKIWKWPAPWAVGLTGCFLLIDLAFLAGNVVKIFQGAWVPLVLASFVFALLWIWTDGRARYRRALNAWSIPLNEFKRQIRGRKNLEPGIGVFLTTRPEFVPLVGRNEWLRQRTAHAKILLITILQRHVPYVPEQNRTHVEELAPGFWRITASFGFMQHPDVTRVLESAPAQGLKLDWDNLVFYLPEACLESRGGWWRQRLQGIYQFLVRNSLQPYRYFRVPPREIIHVGVRLEV